MSKQLQQNGIGNEDRKLADLYTVDGEIIKTGKFSSFKLVAQSAFGVKTDIVNVYSRNGRCIGYVHEADVDDFMAGNGKVMTPKGDWPVKWSRQLIELFDLHNTATYTIASIDDVSPRKLEAIPDRYLYQVFVDAVADDGEGERFRVGAACVLATTRAEAENKAYDEVWDHRLTGASCGPSFMVNQIDRFVHGGWSHIFGNGTNNERDCRIVFDRGDKRLTHLQILDGAKGWMTASESEMADVEDSLKNANEEALESPEDWGLATSEALPDWVVVDRDVQKNAPNDKDQSADGRQRNSSVPKAE